MSEQTMKARQTYLDNIQAKTGKSAQELAAIARSKGLTKARAVTDWLKAEFDLGYGHAGMVWYLMAHEDGPKTPDDRLGKLFSGKKSKWLAAYQAFAEKVAAFGPDVDTYANTTYVNLLRGGKKFGLVQPSVERLDIGVKLKGAAPTERLQPTDSWNAMVTHRVKVTDPEELDAELLGWLRRAYAAVK